MLITKRNPEEKQSHFYKILLKDFKDYSLSLQAYKTSGKLPLHQYRYFVLFLMGGKEREHVVFPG